VLSTYRSVVSSVGWCRSCDGGGSFIGSLYTQQMQQFLGVEPKYNQRPHEAELVERKTFVNFQSIIHIYKA
jgi:hypothetical protein